MTTFLSPDKTSAKLRSRSTMTPRQATRLVRSLCGAVLVFFMPLTICRAQTSNAAPAPVEGSRSAQILIRPGDTIGITVFNAADLSRDVRVSEDGTVNLPLLGDFPVADLSEAEAAHQIDQAFLLHHVLLHPQTAVFIREFATKGVTIVGEVVRPNVYAIAGSRSLIDIIALAGGLTPRADTRITIERRNGTIDQAIIPLPLDNGVLTLRNDTPVYAGDRIVVQRAGMIYVLGEVSRPGGYVMEQNGNITVLQAIAAANGTTRVAGSNSAVLIHRTPSGYTTGKLLLKDISRGKRPDFALQANDVIYIPESTLRNFVVNAPEILGSLAGAAIYSVNK